MTPELNTGGVERTTLEVAEAVTQAGGRALVASEGGILEAALEQAGGELVRLPLASKSPLTLARNVTALRRVIREHDISIVHARSRAPAWSAYLAARREGVFFVTTFHGIYNGRSGPKRLYNSVMARGDVVIANSQFTADHIRRAYPGLASRLAVIPRGVDLSLFNPERIDPARLAAMRERFGLDRHDRRPIVLLPARLTRWKGQTVALAALRALRQSRSPEIVLVMVGDDQGRTDYSRALDDYVRAHDLGDCVRRVGHVDDMPHAYAAAHAVLIPSTDPEAFGRTAVEAQALGRPVIASRGGALVETVIPGSTGWLFEPGNPEALAEALEAMLALDAAAYQAMSAMAVANAGQYSIDRLKTATLAVYDSLLTRS